MGQKTDIENQTIIVNNWLQFTTANENFFVFRKMLEKILLNKISVPERRSQYFEDAAINTLVTILSAEDSAKGKTNFNFFFEREQSTFVCRFDPTVRNWRSTQNFAQNNERIENNRAFFENARTRAVLRS